MQGSVECQVTLMYMMDILYADMKEHVGIDRVEISDYYEFLRLRPHVKLNEKILPY